MGGIARCGRCLGGQVFAEPADAGLRRLYCLFCGADDYVRADGTSISALPLSPMLDRHKWEMESRRGRRPKVRA